MKTILWLCNICCRMNLGAPNCHCASFPRSSAEQHSRELLARATLCFQDTPGSKALQRDFTNRTEHLCLVSCRSFMWLVWRQHLWNWHLCRSWIQGGFWRINSQIKSISWNENSLTKSFFTHRWHFITGNPVEICFTRIFIFQHRFFEFSDG